MKKLIILMALMSCWLSATTKTYTFEYSEDDFIFQPNYPSGVHICAPTDFSHGEYPDPAIPVNYVNLAIHYGFEMENLSISHSEPRLIKENIEVSVNLPDMPTYTGSSDYSDGQPPTPTGIYPKSNAEYRQINYLYEIPYLSFDLCPFVYDSDAKKLYFIDRFTIDFDCYKVIAKEQPKISREQVKERLLDIVANQDEVDEILDRVPKFAAYQPLFVDGRMWKTVHGAAYLDPSSSPSLRTHQVLTVNVDGNAFINGKACKRLKVTEETFSPDGPTYDPSTCDGCISLLSKTCYFYGYEAERKIYVCRHGESSFRLYMDLNGNYGDFAKGLGTIMNESCEIYPGLISRTLTTGYADRLGLVEKKNWMEGIGSNVLANCLNSSSASATYSEDWQPASYLVVCEQDGTPLYDIREILSMRGINYGDGTTGVPEFSTSVDTEPVYYSFDGIRVAKPVKGSLYIRVVGDKVAKIVY